MPAVGDQHKSDSAASTNPFEEEQPRISEYTAQEIATLQSRLDKQLGPEYISSRPGAAGQRVHYLAAEKVINLANQVFGFNGWSSAIKAITIDFIDENQHTGKISLGLSVIIRVTLRDGTYHEDIGYGQIENCKGKAAAFEKAKKEGTTDGLKRTLRTFGNVLGNCIYDKDFLGRVTKIKVAPSRWDVDNLHRHPDFVVAKKDQVQEEISRKNNADEGSTSNTEADDEFGDADFSHVDFSEGHTGHPDEVILPAENTFPIPPIRPSAITSGPGRPLERPRSPGQPANGGATTPSRNPQQRMTGPPYENRGSVASAERNYSHDPRRPPGQQPANIKATSGTSLPNAPPILPHQALPPAIQAQSQAHNNPPHNQQQHQQHQPSPVGFYSARAASALNESGLDIPAGPPPASQFNPHSESPSIRKTTGVDHSRSVPVKRAAGGAFVAESPATTNVTAASAPPPAPREGMPGPTPARDFVKPSSDMHRRIGAPGAGGMASPTAKASGMNGSAYRPPSRRPPTTTDPNPNINTNTAIPSPAHHNPPSAPASASATSIGIKRPPLSDISTNAPPRQQTEGPATAPGPGVVVVGDAKRQKVGPLENKAVALPQQQQQQQQQQHQQSSVQGVQGVQGAR